MGNGLLYAKWHNRILHELTLLLTVCNIVADLGPKAPGGNLNRLACCQDRIYMGEGSG